jgi:hypothetical protein
MLMVLDRTVLSGIVHLSLDSYTLRVPTEDSGITAGTAHLMTRKETLDLVTETVNAYTKVSRLPKNVTLRVKQLDAYRSRYWGMTDAEMDTIRYSLSCLDEVEVKNTASRGNSEHEKYFWVAMNEDDENADEAWRRFRLAVLGKEKDGEDGESSIDVMEGVTNTIC